MNGEIIELTINRLNDPDFELVKAAKKGDQEAFSELVEKYSHQVFALCIKILNDYGEAEDLTQEVFLKVYKNIKKFKGKSKFSTWLYQITLNAAINRVNYLKKRHHYDISSINVTSVRGGDEDYGIDLADPSRTSEDDVIGKETYQIILKAINELPEEFRVVILLRDVEEKSYQEIAEILNVPEGTVKSRIHRAREILKKKLEPYLEGG